MTGEPPVPPAFGLLSDRQQRGLDCAHCDRPLAGARRLVGVVYRDRRTFGVYACDPACSAPGWRTGFCWWCRSDGVPVVWLGPAVHGAWHAHVHACAPCCHWLTRRIDATRAE